jgi:sec-independent protein translocase protein TatB
MFGLSFSELIIIAVLALILLGPDKLPDAAKTIAKGLKEFKKATDDLKGQVEQELKFDELFRDDATKIANPKPALVPPVGSAPVPGPAGPPPSATAANVPGLEAAFAGAEPVAAPEPAPAANAPAAPTPEAPTPAAAPAAPTAAAQS